jgi:hypothetical protein
MTGLGKPDRSQEPCARINNLELIDGHHTGQRRAKVAIKCPSRDITLQDPAGNGRHSTWGWKSPVAFERKVA